MGYRDNKALLIVDSFGLLAFAGVRLIYGPYLYYFILLDTYHTYSLIPFYLTIITLFATSTGLVMNFVFFHEDFKAFMRSFKRYSLKVKAG